MTFLPIQILLIESLALTENDTPSVNSGFQCIIISSISDETRTSYLLQGVQSAWDSVGRRKPQNHVGHEHVANQGGADFAAAAASTSFNPHNDQVSRGEEVMGAEALVCVPQRGNNVSSQII